ncbi:AlpA family transcriptional regulator [Klebsiella pneumoniae]|uniref:AlpA family transcriptional regulator n=1 Tax=Klebsiella pneumoniae TaxID=573 RepID=UPI003CFE6879
MKTQPATGETYPKSDLFNKASSRVTIRKYTERYNFPKPVRTYPKQYLRSAIVEWILNGGVNQKSS